MTETTEVTYAELSTYDTKEKLYVAIHEKVYDVTKFVDEHPGGEEVLLDVAGQDATEAFEVPPPSGHFRPYTLIVSSKAMIGA
ncbi:hypothetical protein ABW21_db0206536 [Orbilia brochopaga]|nr:hypothetical protein ABW21_db0206536 [Drechslerella brochopaga]